MKKSGKSNIPSPRNKFTKIKQGFSSKSQHSIKVFNTDGPYRMAEAIRWSDSGKGPEMRRELTLDDARQLAIQAGFVYTDDESRPIEKRANLQAMFDFCGVTSLSSFRQKFYHSALDPTTDKRHSSASLKLNESEEWGKISYGANKVYVGQTTLGRQGQQGRQPQGQGILVSEGNYGTIQYVGSFKNGLRHGFGTITTPRGEAFYGYFTEDVMWGPGSYVYPNPEENYLKDHCIRIRFDGMMNGKPCGKGVMTWSDGRKEVGIFEGSEIVTQLSWDDCHGVLLVAEENANLAKRIAAEVVEEAKRHHLWPLGAPVLPV